MGLSAGVEGKAGWSCHARGEAGSPPEFSPGNQGPSGGLVESDVGIGERRLGWGPACKMGGSLRQARAGIVPACAGARPASFTGGPRTSGAPRPRRLGEQHSSPRGLGAHVDLSPSGCHVEVGTWGGPRASASSSVERG